MTGSPQRVGLLLIVVVLFLLIMLKGRGLSRVENPVAFFSDNGNDLKGVTVRIEGDVIIPGVYRFNQEVDTAGVINMTVPSRPVAGSVTEMLFKRINSGTVVSVSAKEGELLEITTRNMRVAEKIILGVPLDMNKMSVSDWKGLPGIGRVTAERIVAYRQNIGEFSSIQDLLHVTGIGDVMLGKIEHLFMKR